MSRAFGQFSSSATLLSARNNVNSSNFHARTFSVAYGSNTVDGIEYREEFCCTEGIFGVLVNIGRIDKLDYVERKSLFLEYSSVSVYKINIFR